MYSVIVLYDVRNAECFEKNFFFFNENVFQSFDWICDEDYN